MNLANIYVILAWYSKAERLNRSRITNQEFDADYINEKIKEISEFQFDAHHWNNKHFRENFVAVYGKAVDSYKKMAKRLPVAMHDTADHEAFLKKIMSSDGKEIDLGKFMKETLSKSKSAANRETAVVHKHENILLKASKPVFEMKI